MRVPCEEREEELPFSSFPAAAVEHVFERQVKSRRIIIRKTRSLLVRHSIGHTKRVSLNGVASEEAAAAVDVMVVNHWEGGRGLLPTPNQELKTPVLFLRLGAACLRRGGGLYLPFNFL